MKPILLLVTFAILALGGAVQAQLSADVWVTTQDFSSLRAGPGTYWERLAVIPPATTLRAIGRTVQAHWLQVEYGEQHGWISARLLIWSGDWMSLPVDGVDALSFVRRQEVIMATQDAIYSRPSSRLSDQVTLPEGCAVEITGRLGSVLPLWLQFRCTNQPGNTYYWSIAYNNPSEGSWLSLPNLATSYAFGRLLEQINTERRRSAETFFFIRSVWFALDAGQVVSCNAIPDPARTFVYAESDLTQSPIMISVVRAVETWISETNRARELFVQACAGQGVDRVLPPELIQEAMEHVRAADRAEFFLSTLFEPLAGSDPALGGDT